MLLTSRMFGRCLRLLSGPGLSPLRKPYCCALGEPHRVLLGEHNCAVLNVAYCLALNVDNCLGFSVGIRCYILAFCDFSSQSSDSHPSYGMGAECCGMLQRLTVWRAPWYARARSFFICCCGQNRATPYHPATLRHSGQFSKPHTMQRR